MQFFISLVLFYYLNGIIPLTNGHLFVPNGKKSEEIEGEKLNVKVLCENFRGTKSNGLVSSPFFSALAIFLGFKKDISK